MEPTGNQNIVVVGLWNTRIFSIPWISGKLFDNSDVTGEFPVLPGFPTKFSVSGVEILPDSSRLMIQAAEPSDGLLQRVEDTATRILHLLPETPVSAVGLNIPFIQRDPPPNLSTLFELPDADLLAQNGIVAREIAIIRQAPFEQAVINIQLNWSEGGVKLTMNFHRDVTNATEAATFLQNNAVRLKTKALELLQSIYDIHLEEA
jgi:hypothetical protein